MDISSTQILSKLFDRINRVGDCNLLDCGIDQHHNLVFGLRVSPSDSGGSGKELARAIKIRVRSFIMHNN